MLSYSALSSGTPEAAWALLAQPARWHRWAPHIRGARGLGAPEVEAGRRGSVRLGPGLPVPVTITAKTPGRSWDWRVGPIEMEHRVTPAGRGAEVTIVLRGPAAVERALRLSYGPLVALLVRNLARVAGQSSS